MIGPEYIAKQEKLVEEIAPDARWFYENYHPDWSPGEVESIVPRAAKATLEFVVNAGNAWHLPENEGKRDSMFLEAVNRFRSRLPPTP